MILSSIKTVFAFIDTSDLAHNLSAAAVLRAIYGSSDDFSVPNLLQDHTVYASMKATVEDWVIWGISLATNAVATALIVLKVWYRAFSLLFPRRLLLRYMAGVIEDPFVQMWREAEKAPRSRSFWPCLSSPALSLVALG